MSDEYEVTCPYCLSPDTYHVHGTQYECYECNGMFFVDDHGARCRDSFIMVSATPTQ